MILRENMGEQRNESRLARSQHKFSFKNRRLTCDKKQEYLLRRTGKKARTDQTSARTLGI